MIVASAWERRLRTSMLVVDILSEKPARLAIVIIVVIALLYMGYLPSALTRVEAKVDAHDVRLAEAVQRRANIDDRLVEILEHLTAEIRARNHRDRIRECAEITDRELRAKCLE